MTPAILGRKIGMTRVYDEKGAIVPVTVIQAGPCVVTQVKTADGKDGYNAVQLGFETIDAKYSTMPEIGHAAKAGVAPQRFFREVRLATPSDKAVGDAVLVDSFDGVQYVDVVGISKGKGFAGVMKRYNFGGMGASHGTERKHRARGSIASVATNRGHSGKPKKGVRMAGHMGDDRVTTRNHPLVRIDTENNVLLVKG
ncbi:MAG TPA: 50S ribosomal protein L3, partial [Tepidisphaeraceae bacterium]